MRLDYHADTDALYISLTDRPGADVVEVSEDVVVDVDSEGVPVGIDISANASSIVDLKKLGLRRVEDTGRDAALELDTGFMVKAVTTKDLKDVG